MPTQAVHHAAQWIVYGRFEKAKGDAVIQEWRGSGRFLATVLRRGVSHIMKRPAVRRLHHRTAAFTITRVS